jgi:hypothetical protein
MQARLLRQAGRGLGFGSSGTLQGFEHLLAMDGDIDGGLDPQANLVAADIDDRYDNVVADYNPFVSFAR